MTTRTADLGCARPAHTSRCNLSPTHSATPARRGRAESQRECTRGKKPSWNEPLPGATVNGVDTCTCTTDRPRRLEMPDQQALLKAFGLQTRSRTRPA